MVGWVGWGGDGDGGMGCGGVWVWRGGDMLVKILVWALAIPRCIGFFGMWV